MYDLRLRRGVTALHERLLHVIRNCDLSSRPLETNAVASALSLMLLGHNGIVEGVVRDAARDAARLFTPAMTDDDIIALFLSRLPLDWDGEPVRELFFADVQQDNERLAQLVDEYMTMTEHGQGVRALLLNETREARDLAVAIVETLLRPAAAWQPPVAQAAG